MAPSLPGSRWQLIATVVLSAGGVASCAPTAQGASPLQLQNRATYDLGCAPYSLAIHPLDARTRLVTGCGRRLLYVEDCQPIRGRAACAWKLDTASFAQTQWPQWAAAPAPTTVVIVPPPAASHAPPTETFEGAPAPPPPAASAVSVSGALPAAGAAPPPPSSTASELAPPPSGRAQAGGREIPVDLFDSRK